jgi:iron complex transport system permease protein
MVRTESHPGAELGVARGAGRTWFALLRRLPRQPGVLLITLVVTLAVAVVASLGVGRYPVGLRELAEVAGARLLGWTHLAPARLHLLENLLFEIRLPRVLAAVLVGSALAVSGASYQAMFVNPLVCPGLLGVLSGASFGAALGMVAFDSWAATQAATLAGGVMAVMVAVAIASTFRSSGTLMLVLGGVVSGAFFSALVSIVKVASDPQDKLPAIVYWLMGNLAMADRTVVQRAAIPMVIGLIVLMALGRPLNALSMGDEEARSLGVPVRAVRLIVISCATLISTLTVVMAGNIGWVGLIIPHAARLLVGSDNELLLPASGLLGAIYLLLVDDVARVAFGFEIPIGILTALLGIPFFALVLRSARKEWS